MSNQELPPLAVNISEAARLLGFGKSYLYSALRRGDIKLPMVRLGSKSLVRVVDLEAWLAAQAGAAQNAAA